MSQTWHLPLLTTDTLSASRGYLNDAFEALRTCFSGSSEPGTPVRGQFFVDTDDNTWKIYNGSSWTTLGDIDLAYAGLLPRTAGSSYPLSGSLYCGNYAIKQVATPVDSTDATNKAYADSKLSLAGGTMTGAIVCGANKVTSARTTPNDDAEFVRKDYVDGKLAKTGGTMSGAISMGSTSKITDLATATAAGDAVNKSMLDGRFDTSTGHDHDGTDSKRVPYAALDGAGAPAVGYGTQHSYVAIWASYKEVVSTTEMANIVAGQKILVMVFARVAGSGQPVGIKIQRLDGDTTDIVENTQIGSEGAVLHYAHLDTAQQTAAHIYRLVAVSTATGNNVGRAMIVAFPIF